MADIVTREKRSQMMSGIRSKNTKPEIIVRSMLHSMGLRFRLHSKELPGSPDIVLPKHRAVVFVHGCFWHRHENCKYAYNPKSRIDFWQNKFFSNQERDRLNQKSLKSDGWRVIVIWECETKHCEKLERKLKRLFCLK